MRTITETALTRLMNKAIFRDLPNEAPSDAEVLRQLEALAEADEHTNAHTSLWAMLRTILPTRHTEASPKDENTTFAH